MANVMTTSSGLFFSSAATPERPVSCDAKDLRLSIVERVRIRPIEMRDWGCGGDEENAG